MRAVAGRAVDPAPCDVEPLDPRAAIRALPPLIKGYWRLGAKFGPQAVVDESFGATDVFAVMPVAEIEPRYLAHFGGDRAAAARRVKARERERKHGISKPAKMLYSVASASGARHP